MALFTTPKDPNSDLDWEIDWSDILDPGDTIQASAWFISHAPDNALVINKYPDTNTVDTATVWLSGGTDGKDYQVTNRITTVNNRVVDRTLIVPIRSQ